jgi:hypothetical protein
LNRTPAALFLAVATLLLIGGCGGEEGGNENPQQLLGAAAENLGMIDSGLSDLDLKLDVSGGSQPGEFEMKVGGAFQGGDGGFPKFDLDADLRGESGSQDISGTGGLTATGEGAFVSFQGTDYQVPQELYDRFVTTFNGLQGRYSGRSQSLLKPLVDPANFTDLSNEGSEEISGVDTFHVSGSLDVDKLVAYLKEIGQRRGASQQQIAAVQGLTGIIETADFDFFTGKDDNLLRKVEADIELNPPDLPDSPDSVQVDFSLTLSNVNQPQTISAPANPQPFSELLKRLPTSPSQLGVGAGFPQGGVENGGALPETGGSTTAPENSAIEAYQQCLSQAAGQEALQKCADLLTP